MMIFTENSDVGWLPATTPAATFSEKDLRLKHCEEEFQSTHCSVKYVLWDVFHINQTLNRIKR